MWKLLVGSGIVLIWSTDQDSFDGDVPGLLAFWVCFLYIPRVLAKMGKGPSLLCSYDTHFGYLNLS